MKSCKLCSAPIDQTLMIKVVVFVIGYTLFWIRMDQKWKPGHVVGIMVMCFFLSQNLCLSWCLNDEGKRFLSSGIWVFFLVACKSQGKWWMSVLVAGLALLSLRERVVNDPFGALLNWKDEDGVINPCSWFGVECSDGKVVVLWVNFFAFLVLSFVQKSEGILLFYLLLVAQNFFFSYKGTLIDKKCTIGCFIVRISSILHRSRKL